MRQIEGASEFFSNLASQPVSKKIRGPLICNSKMDKPLRRRFLGYQSEFPAADQKSLFWLLKSLPVLLKPFSPQR